MGKTKTTDDVDRINDTRRTSPPRKKPRKQPPEPWPVPEFEPLHIDPQDDYSALTQLPPHVNPGRPWQIFHPFFTDEVLQAITDHTNAYAALHQPSGGGRLWKPTITHEILAYIATYIYIGLHKEPEVSQYWNIRAREPLLPQVSKHIGLKRRQQIDRFFHISKPQETLAEERQEQLKRSLLSRKKTYRASNSARHQSSTGSLRQISQ